MLNENFWNEMNRACKTGEVKKELAKIEINENRFFTHEDIQTIINGCNINIITRKDIDFEKLLLTNSEYQKARNKMLNSLDYIKENKDSTEEEKREVLKLVDIKDNIYNKLKEEFYN